MFDCPRRRGKRWIDGGRLISFGQHVRSVTFWVCVFSFACVELKEGMQAQTRYIPMTFPVSAHAVLSVCTETYPSIDTCNMDLFLYLCFCYSLTLSHAQTPAFLLSSMLCQPQLRRPHRYLIFMIYQHGATARRVRTGEKRRRGKMEDVIGGNEEKEMREGSGEEVDHGGEMIFPHWNKRLVHFLKVCSHTFGCIVCCRWHTGGVR